MYKPIEVPIGRPPGTSFSVTLFIIYIDNITNIKLYASINLFARLAMDSREQAW